MGDAEGRGRILDLDFLADFALADFALVDFVLADFVLADLPANVGGCVVVADGVGTCVPSPDGLEDSCPADLADLADFPLVPFVVL